MTKTNKTIVGAIAGAAVGSAAIAAALLYSKRKAKADGKPPRTSNAPHTPTGEPPETD
ncbi:MAG: hypothetical protein IE933_10095 [Sphingomonadales bacterium]|nr:hypothetical protein [Sphingomonadales bacterium]MBD3773308.1 hypothetical protein [Paracoccaceae bacterium]